MSIIKVTNKNVTTTINVDGIAENGIWIELVEIASEHAMRMAPDQLWDMQRIIQEKINQINLLDEELEMDQSTEMSLIMEDM